MKIRSNIKGTFLFLFCFPRIGTWFKGNTPVHIQISLLWPEILASSAVVGLQLWLDFDFSCFLHMQLPLPLLAFGEAISLQPFTSVRFQRVQACVFVRVCSLFFCFVLFFGIFRNAGRFRECSTCTYERLVLTAMTKDLWSYPLRIVLIIKTTSQFSFFSFVQYCSCFLCYIPPTQCKVLLLYYDYYHYYNYYLR